jgi:hypothetical protein
VDWIYAGRDYTVFQRGTVLKGVKCESCGTEYVYALTRVSKGVAHSPYFLDNKGAQRRAGAEAQRNLEKRLARECAAAPCPRCGWVQKHMFAVARGEQWGKHSQTGCSTFWVAVLFGSTLLGVHTFTNWLPPDRHHILNQALEVVAWSLFAAAILLALGAWVRYRRWDPNSQPVQERLERAARICMTKEELQRSDPSADSNRPTSGG